MTDKGLSVVLGGLRAIGVSGVILSKAKNLNCNGTIQMNLAEKIVLGLIWVALLILASDAAFNLFSAVTQGSFR
jgi:hypothetical protein